MVFEVLWLILLFFFFNINWKIYHRTSYSPAFSLKRLGLKVAETVLQLIGCRCTWAICCSVNLCVSRALKWSHPPFHSKIFLVSALCIHNLFLTYQHSFPLFGFLSSHDTLPIVLCSRSLSVFLSPPSSLAPTLSPGEAALLPTPRWKATADNKNAI